MKNFMTHKFVIRMFIFSMIFFIVRFDINAFNGYTHKYVTRIGLENISKFYENKKESNVKSDERYWETIIEYSVKPDEDEIEGAYKYHFYNFLTEENFLNEKDSALTRMISHFENAVKEYKNKNRKEAFQELGRSIHFMEDLNTPVHTVYSSFKDAVLKFPLHVMFEKKCDEICDNVKSKVLEENMDYYKLNSLNTIGKSSSVLSENNFYGLEENNVDFFYKVANNAILNAQERVTGVLYKFFKEVHSDCQKEV
ncbi:MAG: zinc dependent phospholipase C family protein [Acutalibacteraceae bacterium]